MKEKRLTGFMLAAAMLANTAVGALAYDYTDNSGSVRQLPTGDLSLPKSIRIDLAEDVDLSRFSAETDVFTVSESVGTGAQASTGGSGGGGSSIANSTLKLYNTMPDYGYSYEYLLQFDNGAEMQNCYDGILQMCKAYVGNQDDNTDANLDIFDYWPEFLKFVGGSSDYVYNLTENETDITFFAFIQDHPEFWWLENASSKVELSAVAENVVQQLEEQAKENLEKEYQQKTEEEKLGMTLEEYMEQNIEQETEKAAEKSLGMTLEEFDAKCAGKVIPTPVLHSDYASRKLRETLDTNINNELGKYLDKVLALPEQDSYTVAKFVHDEICSKVKYGWLTDDQGNYTLDDKGEKIALETSYAHNIVGVLDGDPKTDPVCESYAKAYQLIMTAAGQQCLFVKGLANGGGHGWNLVEFNNQYYYVDLTWDDVDTDSGSTVVDEYFAKGSTTYAVDHQVFTPDMFLSKEESEGLTTAQQWLKCTEYFMPELTVSISDADYDDAYDTIRLEYINLEKDSTIAPGIRISIKKQENNAKLFVVTYNEDNTVRKISVKDLDNEQWNKPYISYIEDFTSPSKIKAFLWENQNFKPVAKSKGIIWTPRGDSDK